MTDHAPADIPRIPKEMLDELYRHAEETYPAECCGCIIGPKNGKVLTRLKRAENVYDRYHAEDPAAYPRTSKTAYLIEPKELLFLTKEMRANGEALKIIYHSHIEVGAYFSEEDKRVATCEGRPVFPDASYLVISCRKGRADGAALFTWDVEKSDFMLTKKFG